MFCPKCGSENPDNAKFCGSCGNSMTVVRDNVPPTVNNPAQNYANKPPVSKELKIGIIIATLFIPFIGIIMGWIYMTDMNIEKKKVGKTWLYVGIGILIIECILYSIGISSSGYNY